MILCVGGDFVLDTSGRCIRFLDVSGWRGSCMSCIQERSSGVYGSWFYSLAVGGSFVTVYVVGLLLTGRVRCIYLPRTRGVICADNKS